MKEILKKVLYNLYKEIGKSDSNDRLYYINLLIANSDLIGEILTSDWKISNKYNSKSGAHLFFEFADKMRPYVFDGDGDKRYLKAYDFINVEYPENTLEENQAIAKSEMAKLLPGSTDWKITELTKEDLEDYSEKCYRIKKRLFGEFLPKSQVAFDGENVVLPLWLAKKMAL